MNRREAHSPDAHPVDVLFVSGNRTYARAARLVLSAQGYRVTTALDAAAALAAARDADFALLLVDERLPGTDGPQWLQTLRAQARDAHIVMLIAEPSAMAMADALRAGAQAVHRRPPAASGLARILRRELPGESPLLDDAIVAELREAIARRDARATLLDRFEAETRALWSTANEALGWGQAQAFAAALHRLRGATAGIGALACERQFADLARRAGGPLPDSTQWNGCQALLEQSVAALRKAFA